MHIKVKLFVSLARYLPVGAVGNEAEIEIDGAETPRTVLERLHVPHEQAHLWLLNGTYIDPDDRDRALFGDGDTLAVWPPVAGG